MEPDRTAGVDANTMGTSWIMPWTAALVGATLSCTSVAEASPPGPLDPILADTQLEVRMEPGHARLTYLYRFRARGPTSSGIEVDETITLPVGAVAVGLRFKGGGAWQSAAVAAPDIARDRYDALGVAESDPPSGLAALLEHEGPEVVALRAFPVVHDRPSHAEITVLAPTRYDRGVHQLILADAPAPLRLRVLGPAKAGVTVDLSAVGSRQTLTLWPKSGVGTIRLAARQALPLLASLAVVPLHADRRLVRYRVHAAPRLSKAPVGAYVVLLVDSSRSLSQADIEAQQKAAAYVLAHLPDVRVAVVRFDRRPYPRPGGFVDGATALADLAAMPVTRRNGSHVDAALATARSLLATAPGGAVKRVYLFTDALVRTGLGEPLLRRAFDPKLGVVHVVSVSAGDPSLSRDDHHAWKGLVEATGGAAWFASARDQTAQGRRDGAKVFEELARPLRLHRLRLTVDGVAQAIVEAPAELNEGEGFDQQIIATGKVGVLRLQGMSWGTPVRLYRARDARESKLWAALAVASGVPTEAEIETLARRVGAVSRFTSLVVATTGTRPVHGLGLRGMSFSTGCRCGGTGRGGTGIGFGPPAPERDRRLLGGELAAAAKACAAREPRAVIETQAGEILDIAVTAHHPKVASCVAERLWAFELPAWFARGRRTFKLSLVGAS